MKPTLLAFIIAMPFSVLLRAQISNKNIEEIKAIISKENLPSIKCDTALFIAQNLFMKMKRVEAQEILLDALKIATDNNLENKKVPLLMKLGRCQEAIGTLDSAIIYNKMAISLITDQTEKYRGRLYNYLGRYYQRSNELDSMLRYYTLTETWNNNNEPYRNWVLYEQWHKKHLDFGDLNKAENLLLKAYAITKGPGEKMDHGLILYRLKQIFSRKKDIKNLAKYSKEYFELIDHKNGNKSSMHGLELGSDLSNANKILLYEDLIQENKRISFDIPNNYLYPTLINLYISENQPKKALHYLAMMDTTEQELVTQSDFHNLYQKAYEKDNNSTRALYHLKQKNKIDNRRREIGESTAIRELEIKYDTQKKESNLTLLKAQNEYKNFQIQQYKKNNWIIGGGLLFTTALLFLLAKLYFQNKNKNSELIEKNHIIENALKEKNILLREIHHRVKNNLQVISSLLNLQTYYISDDKALTAINESKNRVTSMALIHQNLYLKNDLTTINCKTYFDDLIENIFDTYNISENEINLIKNITDIKIDVDSMIPLGLIVNELICNSLKHAFIENIKGEISLELVEINNALRLTIFDNGKGYSEDEFYSSKSFGNKLILAFMQKLNGEIRIDNDSKTKFVMNFKNFKTYD